MSNLLTVGDLQVAPGNIGFGRLVPGKLAWSQELSVPLIAVNGAHAGPRLWLSSVVHGPEATGTEVIRRVVREAVDPNSLRGSIVAIPVANPLAFQAGSYETPDDALNLNRVFPGSPDGTITHRLAHTLFQEARHCDFVIDLHANPGPAMHFAIAAQTSNAKVVQRSLEIGRQFGVTTRLRQAEAQAVGQRWGALIECAADEGIPGIIAELLYWYRIDPLSVEVGVRGVLNVMKALGMIDGQIEPQPVFVVHGELVGAEVGCVEGGLVYFTKDAGDAVQQGEIVAFLRDPYGEIVEEIKSPVTGWVTAYPLPKNQAALSGDSIAYFVYLEG